MKLMEVHASLRPSLGIDGLHWNSNQAKAKMSRPTAAWQHRGRSRKSTQMTRPAAASEILVLAKAMPALLANR
jgi:hypothetical protein